MRSKWTFGEARVWLPAVIFIAGIGALAGRAVMGTDVRIMGLSVPANYVSGAGVFLVITAGLLAAGFLGRTQGRDRNGERRTDHAFRR